MRPSSGYKESEWMHTGDTRKLLAGCFQRNETDDMKLTIIGSIEIIREFRTNWSKMRFVGAVKLLRKSDLELPSNTSKKLYRQILENLTH